MRPSLDDHRRRVTALETWQRWATGRTVQHGDLRDAVDTLTNGQAGTGTLTTLLAGLLHEWANRHRVGLHGSPGPDLAVQPAGTPLEL